MEIDGMKLMPVFSGERFRELVQYPVMVETWEKKDFGRLKRRWVQEFTLTERQQLGKWYAKFYHWYFVSGTPKTVALTSINTLNLLQRAVAFFASY